MIIKLTYEEKTPSVLLSSGIDLVVLGISVVARQDGFILE
jgi:hypothetical protein